MQVVRVCGLRQNLHVFSLYRKPEVDDLIFHCLLTPMAAVQAEDVRASFLFVWNLNGHNQEWLVSTTTNRHGVAPLTSQLCLGAISWLSARSMHVVEPLTF